MAENSAEFQKFLDENQYSKNGVLRYERIFGHTFISTGGKETTDRFLKTISSLKKKGSRVLDVGCGIGGSAFLMDKDYGATVRGVDLSKNMIHFAQVRQQELGSKNTSFHIEDITKAEYEEGEFDLIYSRDAILHIEDKITLYTNFLKWLKPGGELFVSDYACRSENLTPEFEAYRAQRNYQLVSPDQYKDIVTRAGFVDVEVTDLKEYFLEVLGRERERTVAMKEAYVSEFSQKDYDDIVDGWTSKVGRVEEGSQKWISVYARKAL